MRLRILDMVRMITIITATPVHPLGILGRPRISAHPDARTLIVQSGLVIASVLTAATDAPLVTNASIHTAALIVKVPVMVKTDALKFEIYITCKLEIHDVIAQMRMTLPPLSDIVVVLV